jgi:hypothetical protein
VLAYGTLSYGLFLVTFLYAVGFIGGFLTPTRLDGPLEGSLSVALGIDFLLLALFALQHSGMARPPFKKWVKQYLPEPAERITYVLLSSVALIVLFALWQPLGGDVRNVSGEAGRAALYVLFAIVGVIMKAAPIGAFGAMAFTIGKYGVASLIPLAKLMGTFYLTCLLFILLVLGSIASALIGMIDLNAASEDDLNSLPGIGATRAKAIIAGRPYAQIDDLVSLDQ